MKKQTDGSTSTKPRKSLKLSGAGGQTKTPARSKKPADPCPCERIGKKRSDLRCKTPDGQEWASPLEARVFFALKVAGYAVRRTTAADALKYATAVKQGRCTSCQGCEIVQDRTYTPDLIVYDPSWDADIMLEIKGYFAGPKRNLFRAARQSNPSADIRLIASTGHTVTKGKTKLSDWAKRFRIPFAVWNGTIPEKL